MFKGCSFGMAEMSKAMGGSMLRIPVPVPCAGVTPDGAAYNSSECPFNGAGVFCWEGGLLLSSKEVWVAVLELLEAAPWLFTNRATHQNQPYVDTNTEWSDVANDWVRKNTKLNLDDWPFRIYVVPKGNVCGWGGMGYVGCYDDCRSWINGDLWSVSGWSCRAARLGFLAALTK